LEGESVRESEVVQSMELGNLIAPSFVNIPRKAKLFRVLMDRKLGISWEHGDESLALASSLGTNQLIDGYQELQTNSLFQSTDSRATHKFNRNSLNPIMTIE
jgi:hypothetical protein